MKVKHINDLNEILSDDSNSKDVFDQIIRYDECIFVLLQEIYISLRGTAEFIGEYRCKTLKGNWRNNE